MTVSAPEPGPPWSGSLALLPGAVVYDGPAGYAGWHAHHALQIMVSGGAPFVLTTEAGSGDRTAREAIAATVASGVPHLLEASSDRMVLLLVEPLGARGRALTSNAGAPVDDAGSAALRDRMLDAGPSSTTLLERAAEILVPRADSERRPALVSGAVRAALGYLEMHAADPAASLVGAASVAHLSPTRLTHRFSAEVGMPFRRYALWVRLRRAVEAVASGTDNLSEAAVEAGFSDGAHLSRAFRRNFGLPPSALLRMRIAEADWPERGAAEA